MGVVSMMAFVVFLVDLVLQSALDRKQVFSFFWWMDFVR